MEVFLIVIILWLIFLVDKQDKTILRLQEQVNDRNT